MKQCAQLVRQLRHLIQLYHFPRAAERLLEPLVVERLDQVIDRGEIESRDGVIVRRREDDRRHVVGADLSYDFQPSLPGHLDVEEHDIGLQLADRGDRRESVVGSAHDLDVVFVRQQILEPLAREPLVIGDQNAKGLGFSHSPSRRTSAVVRRSARLSNGISIRAMVPPPGLSRNVRLCAPPYSCSRRWRMFLSPTPRSSPLSDLVRPGPLSPTLSTSRSSRLIAVISILPVPTTFSTPCLTAFSTSGWRMRLGTNASRASSPTWTSISSRSSNLICMISRYRSRKA